MLLTLLLQLLLLYDSLQGHSNHNHAQDRVIGGQLDGFPDGDTSASLRQRRDEQLLGPCRHFRH